MSDTPSTKPPLPPRQHPAHPVPVQRHNRPIILHVTVCTASRRALLASDLVHGALRAAWVSARSWVVGYYMVMPDHIHLFCAQGCGQPPPVQAWSKYWKRLVSQSATALCGQWIPDCWDTQMRSQEHYSQKLEYVAQNPVRCGLVAHSEEWPYQGKINDLAWIL